MGADCGNKEPGLFLSFAVKCSDSRRGVGFVPQRKLHVEGEEMGGQRLLLGKAGQVPRGIRVVGNACQRPSQPPSRNVPKRHPTAVTARGSPTNLARRGRSGAEDAF